VQAGCLGFAYGLEYRLRGNCESGKAYTFTCDLDRCSDGHVCNAASHLYNDTWFPSSTDPNQKTALP
jgi:hypothetical protein